MKVGISLTEIPQVDLDWTDLGLIDMIIRSFIWPSYSHYDEIIPGVKTKGINWRLEQFGIFSDPFMQAKRGGDRHDVWE